MWICCRHHPKFKQFWSIHVNYVFWTPALSNLFSSFASAETLHLARCVKYACGHYRLHASSLLQLGENEDITTHFVFHQTDLVSQHWFEAVPAICCSLEEILAAAATAGMNKVKLYKTQLNSSTLHMEQFLKCYFWEKTDLYRYLKMQLLVYQMHMIIIQGFNMFKFW